MTIIRQSVLCALFLVLVSLALFGDWAGAVTREQWVSPVPEVYRRATPGTWLESIDAERGRGGYGDLVPLAGALLEAGNRSEIDSAMARQLALYAAPGAPRLQWERFSRAVGEVRLGEAFASLWSALAATVSDVWIQLRFGTLLAGTVCIAAWFVLLAIVVITAVAKGRQFLHDYADSFPRRFRRVSPLCLGILVFTTLWVAGVGPAILLLLGGLALTPYMLGRVRITFGLMAVLGCLLPCVLSSVGREATVAGASAWGIYRVRSGDHGADLMAALEASLRQDSPWRNYVLARVARRNGDLQQARALLEGAAGKLSHGLVATELGSINFLEGKLPEALKWYRQAAGEAPKDAIPYLNQHLVHLKRLELEAADAALAQARAADAGQVEELESHLVGAHGRLLPVSHEISKRWVIEEYFSGDPELPTWATIFRESVFSSSSYLRPELLGVFVLLLALIADRVGAERRSHYCPSCGFVVCPRCSRRVKGSLLCSACWTVDREKNVDVAERERREEKAALWALKNRRWRKAGNLFLPGWSDFYEGRRFLGPLLGSLWALGAGWLAISLVFPLPLFPWGVRSPWIIGVGMLIVAYVVGIWRAVRVKRDG